MKFPETVEIEKSSGNRQKASIENTLRYEIRSTKSKQDIGGDITILPHQQRLSPMVEKLRKEGP